MIFLKKNNHKYNLSIGAIFKNESMGIKEWIDHHIFHGIDHIYLIDDFSSDNYYGIIKPYIDSGRITLFKNDDTNNDQTTAYNKFFKPILHETTWIAIFDLDEYFYSPISIDLKSVIKKYTSNKIIINAVPFNSNGHNKQPKYIVESFTKRCCGYNGIFRPTTKIPNLFVSNNTKCVFKTSYVHKIDIHDSIVSGDTVYETSEQNPNLLINHYIIQSKEFFEKVKMTRGDITRIKNTRDWECFNAIDVGDIDDFRLYEQNKPLFK